MGKRDVRFERQVSTTASFLKTWGVFPTCRDKTAQVTSSVCGLPCLDAEQFGKWRPAPVLWKELGHEGLGSGLPPCSTHHQSGNKPQQRSWHMAKYLWWDWGGCGWSYLVGWSWGGGTGWIWCYSSVLDVCDLVDVCGVSVLSLCLCQDAEWFRAITFISSQKWDCSLVASCHCWNSPASPKMGSSFDIVWSCDTKQTRCSHPIDLNVTSVPSLLTIEKSLHLTCLWTQSFVLK